MNKTVCLVVLILLAVAVISGFLIYLNRSTILGQGPTPSDITEAPPRLEDPPSINPFYRDGRGGE